MTEKKGTQHVESTDGEPANAVHYEDEVFEWREVIRGTSNVLTSLLLSRWHFRRVFGCTMLANGIRILGSYCQSLLVLSVPVSFFRQRSSVRTELEKHEDQRLLRVWDFLVVRHNCTRSLPTCLPLS